MEFNGLQWISMVVAWISHGFQWVSMAAAWVSNGFQWISTELAWISHGFRLMFVVVFHDRSIRNATLKDNVDANAWPCCNFLKQYRRRFRCSSTIDQYLAGLLHDTTSIVGKAAMLVSPTSRINGHLARMPARTRTCRGPNTAYILLQGLQKGAYQANKVAQVEHRHGLTCEGGDSWLRR